MFVSCLAFLVASIVPVQAATVAEWDWDWELQDRAMIWSEDFEGTGCPEGWECTAFTPCDQIGDEKGRIIIYNDGVLRASSHGPCPGAGYQIQSPSFEEMGLDVTKPYVIQFDYAPMHSSWNYPLVSSFVSLVMKDCADGTAKLGWVDASYLTVNPRAFRPVADLPISAEPGDPIPQPARWYDIEVVVMPSVRLDQASFVIYVDGEFKAMGTRGLGTGYRGIAMVDLPAVPWDPATEEMPQVSCCGGGFWDNVAVYQLAEEPQPPRGNPRGIDIHADPNPFNPATRIQFELPTLGFTRLDIFDIAGRQVRTLCSEIRDAGTHTLVWRGVDESGASVASGAYFARVSSGGESATFRLTLVR